MLLILADTVDPCWYLLIWVRADTANTFWYCWHSQALVDTCWCYWYCWCWYLLILLILILADTDHTCWYCLCYWNLLILLILLLLADNADAADTCKYFCSLRWYRKDVHLLWIKVEIKKVAKLSIVAWNYSRNYQITPILPESPNYSQNHQTPHQQMAKQLRPLYGLRYRIS